MENCVAFIEVYSRSFHPGLKAALCIVFKIALPYPLREANGELLEIQVFSLSNNSRERKGIRYERKILSSDFTCKRISALLLCLL